MNVWAKVERVAFQKKYNSAFYKKKRPSNQYSNWRRMVLGRDKRTCVLCRGKDKVQAHHIDRWIDNPIDRFKLSNGVTLCKSCHDKYHSYKGLSFPHEITLELIRHVGFNRFKKHLTSFNIF